MGDSWSAESTGAVEGVFAMGLADFIEEALSSLREMPEGEYSGPDEVSRVIAER
jgi:hypothetical protein